MLRAIVTFLVGAGVMMGAFLTGVAQRVPSFLSRFDETVAEDVQPQGNTVVVPPQRDTVVLRSSRDQDLRAPTVFRSDIADEPQQAPMAVRIEAPQSAGCINTYRFINDTEMPIAFLSDSGRVEVPPGGTASPDSGIAPDQACGPAMRIRAEQ